MDINFLLNYIDQVTLGICLLVGYVLKTAFNKFPNKYIPLSALILGMIIAITVNHKTGINAEVVLGGMASGLASTGLHEMLRNLLAKRNKEDD